MAKDIEVLVHTVTLLTAENKTLRKANEALSRRRKAKMTRLRQREALSVEDGQGIVAQKDAEAVAKADRCSRGGGGGSGQLTSRRCSNCRETGYNVRTCQANAETSDDSIDELG